MYKRRYPNKLREQGLARMPRQEVEAQFFSLMADLDTLLSQRHFLAGEAISIADLGVVAQLDELIRTSDLAPRLLALPHFKAWRERCDSMAPA